MARAIGVKNLHYAPLSADPLGGSPTFGKPTRIEKLINFGTSNNYSEYTFYSDDIVEEAGESLQSESISIEIGYLPNALKAALTGNEYKAEKGIYVTKANVQQPAIALLYEISLSDGSSDYRVLYNCKLKITEQSNETQGDSIESSTYTLEGLAIPLKSLGIFDMQISSADDAADETIITNFFESVQLPTSGLVV